MTIAFSDFVNAFPEFLNGSTYPRGQIDFWIIAAYNQLNAARFGTSLDLAAMLFVAHNIVLSARDAAASNAGGIAGEAKGPTSSKSVDKVSVSYDSGATVMVGAGYWNATSYGQRLYKMMQAFCSGPVYIVPNYLSPNAPSWPINTGTV